MKRSYFIQTFAAIVCIGLSGCDTTGINGKQLAHVAKDWSLVVRASQIIPVYPLTEDLLPGDVFLVQSPIEDQVKNYQNKGFLPLDQLLVRLQPTNYSNFYLGAYGIDSQTNTPYHWKFSRESPTTDQRVDAPWAAFPSYSFTVRLGAGLNLALPVQGVPVALNLMGARSAHGSITIADAHTYGIDVFSLREQVEEWAYEHSARLAEYAPTNHKANYLRVVNRVFLTGRVNVSMISDESFGAAASGGAGKSSSILSFVPDDTGTNLENTLNSVNASLESAALPGGTLKLIAASSRTVSLAETFPKPLVIGYLGFDLPILADGRLGPSVPTQARLTKVQTNPVRIIVFGEDANSARIDLWLKNDARNRDQLRLWLDQQGYAAHGVTDIIFGKQYADLRTKIVSHFQIQIR